MHLDNLLRIREIFVLDLSKNMIYAFYRFSVKPHNSLKPSIPIPQQKNQFRIYLYRYLKHDLDTFLFIMPAYALKALVLTLEHCIKTPIRLASLETLLSIHSTLILDLSFSLNDHVT